MVVTVSKVSAHVLHDDMLTYLSIAAGGRGREWIIDSRAGMSARCIHWRKVVVFATYTTAMSSAVGCVLIMMMSQATSAGPDL